MRDGQPWSVAKDVCKALYGDKGWAASGRFPQGLDAAEKGIGIVDTPGGRQKLGLINESGLYVLIMRSRPEAKAFRKWVTSVVLPAIRKDEAYVMGEEKVASG